MFRWYLLRIGLPVGVMLGLGYALQGAWTAWLDLILTVCLPALALAGAVALASEVLIQHLRRTKVTGGVLVALVFSVTVSGGLVLLAVASDHPHGRWVRLPDTPVPAVAFVGPTCRELSGDDSGTVYVAALGGGYLAYSSRTEPRGKWTREAALPIPSPPAGGGCRVYDTGTTTPRFPRGVVATYRVDDSGVDCGGRRHYILKADHSIWMWSTGSCAIGEAVGLLLYTAVLMLLGLVWGIGRLSTKVPSPWLAESGSGAVSQGV